MLCNDLAGAQLNSLSSVGGIQCGACVFLYILVAISIACWHHVVMMGLFPRAWNMSKTLFVTCYF